MPTLRETESEYFQPWEKQELVESRTRWPSPRGQVDLPFREVFHPLQVPTREMVQGKSGLLEDRNVPH